MKPEKANIAFFGTPAFAVGVLDTLYKKGIVPNLIITAPDAPKGRKLLLTPPPAKMWADSKKIPAIQPESIKDPSFAEKLKSLAPDGWDLFIVAAYGSIIPENILYMPKRKTINVHPSLLPLLRGSSPLQTAILKDMRDTGVTIMRLDKEMDHGPILAQKRMETAIWPINIYTLTEVLSKAGGELIGDILPDILAGTITEHEQDHARATYTKKIEKKDGLINLASDPYKNFLKWNAFKEWPTTYFFAERNGKKIRVTVTEASYENGTFLPKKVIPEGKKEVSFDDFKNQGWLF